jgi:hypothetical protein
MSRGTRVMGLAIAVALLASGVVNRADAGPGVCKPVKVCEPVKATPVPACKPVKQLPPPEVCKPAKPLPPPEVCKPVKACDGVAHAKRAVLQDHIARLASHWKRHGAGKAVYYETPQPAPTKTPPAPTPAPQSPSA